MKRYFEMNPTKPLIYLFTLLLSFTCIAQKKPVIVQDTIKIAVVSKASADSLQKEYVEILKSTNEQLNNYWTPVNWFLGAAGVVVALLAIVATVVFFLQSSDFKRKKEELFDEFRQKTDDLVENANFLIASTENRLSEIIIEGNIEVSKLREKGKENEAQVLKDVVDKVDNVQQKISQDTQFKTIRIDQLLRTVKMECPECGHKLVFMVPHAKKGGSVVCIHCKHLIHYNE